MASYLLFDADRRGFDDGEGNDVSLGEHLDYVDNYGGTPDFWDEIKDVSYQQMKFEVGKMNKNLYVVDQDTNRVVYHAKERELDNEQDVSLD